MQGIVAHQCPFCHGPLKGIPIDVDLTIKQRQIFSMIMNGGPAGIDADLIMNALFKKKSPTTLRTHVHRINRAIRPLRIERHANAYRFVVDKVKNYNQEKADAI